jgi:hypothetical protein
LPSVSPPPPPAQRELPNWHPYTISLRYKEARSKWYTTQPIASQNDKAYRKAAGLPANYSKSELAWCNDYKQMGKWCSDDPSTGLRAWTDEEKMSYLDFERGEDARVHRRMAQVMADQPFSSHRGLQSIWDDVTMTAETDLPGKMVSRSRRRYHNSSSSS